MLARKKLFTRLVTSLTVAWLSTQSSASLMYTLPTAFLVAWFTRLATFVLAVTVRTGVTASFFTRGTVFGTRLGTGMTTEQGTAAVFLTRNMNSTAKTQTAIT